MNDDVFKAPAKVEIDPDELDIDAAVPGLLVRVAGSVMLVSGLFVAMSGIQLWLLFTLYALWVKVTATVMIVLGVAAMGVGGSYFRAEKWAVLVGVPLASTLALISTLWLFYSVYLALFSPLMMLATPLALLAMLLSVVAAPGALKAAAGKAALYR